MGVRSRKKSRNKSRYRIASKRRKASAKRKINPNIECSAVKAAWDNRKPASTNISNMGLVYNLSKIGSSGIKSFVRKHIEGFLVDMKDCINTLAAIQGFCPALKGFCKPLKMLRMQLPNSYQFMRQNRVKINRNVSKSTRETLLGGRTKTGGKSTTAVHQLEQEVCSKIQSEKPGIRLTTAQVEYATAMLDKYGNNYKAMARDPTNYFQDTWKQIEKKIKLFMDNPKYFVPYLKKRGLLNEELLKS